MEQQCGKHLIAYVKTSKVTDWKRLTLSYGDAEHPAFIYRSDDRDTFACHAKKGAVLWVIESHAGAPPSLVARLQIVGQVHATLEIRVVEECGKTDIPRGMLRDFEYGGKRRWYAVGDPRESRFFGYNNVSKALIKTELAGSDAPWHDAEEWSTDFGKSLQRPRIIESGAEELVKYAAELSEQSVFLSWKHCDFEGRHGRIHAIVDALVAKRMDCWWDQRALPSSTALKRLWNKPELLTRLLNYGSMKCNAVLALGTKLWGSPSSKDPKHNWTQREWERADVRFAYEIDGCPHVGWYPPPTIPPFSSDTPVGTVAQDIFKYLDKNCR